MGLLLHYGFQKIFWLIEANFVSWVWKDVLNLLKSLRI